MSAIVYIKCIKGELADKAWKFEVPNRVIVGRDKKGANLVIPQTENTSTISRYQCQFEISPPHILVRDCGSKNGTYVDGKVIGKRDKGVDVKDARKREYPYKELKNGSIIGIGTDGKKVQFQVAITDDGNDDIYNKLDKAMERKVKPADDKAKAKEVLKHDPEAKGEFRNLRVIKELGHGGYGRVLLGEDMDTHKTLAIKQMIPEAATKPQKVKWFLREASFATQLHHPNIVETYAVRQSEDNFNIIMECCDCSVEDLSDVNGGKLGLGLATKIILQLLDGLDYAHNTDIYLYGTDNEIHKVKGLIHRDIKPANLLLNIDEKNQKMYVKLSDFGFAKAFEMAGQTGATLSGQIAGTFGFMSKKQLYSYRYAKPDVDVWAAAATYYTLLTGELVRDFSQDKPGQEIIMEKNSLIPIRQADPTIPAKLAQVIDSVLAEEENCEYPDTTTARQLSNKIIAALR
ncbi:MAG: FHA domain-containing protein [Clostridia bacterium]|nr:FHA domain-containing protein [Clostridia bacterium]NCC44187.1 FHA domain-containing protein [Clostridia bacterium]